LETLARSSSLIKKDLKEYPVTARSCLERRNSKRRNRKNAGIEMSCILNSCRNQNNRKVQKTPLNVTGKTQEL
jgi:hypothetical protein